MGSQFYDLSLQEEEDGEEEQSTYEEGEQGRSSFSIAMSTISDFMKTRIITGGRDEFAVIFYNTDKNDNPMKHPNVYVFVKREQPDANTVQKVASMTDRKFMRDIGNVKITPGDHDAAVRSCDALRYGLWATMDTLQSTNPRNVRHRIIMFSNTEDPIKGLDPSYRLLVLDRAIPLKEMGATLRFFPLLSCKKAFNLNTFWQQLMDKLQDPDDEPMTGSTALTPLTQSSQAPTSSVDVMDRLRCLGEYMKKCLQTRRASTTIKWDVTEELTIACQVFTIFMETKKPVTVKLRAQDNAVLQSNTIVVSEDTGEVVSKVEHKQYRPEKVVARFPRVILQVDDVSAIKHYLPPGLKLLGFKPRHYLKDYHNLTHSSFLRPTERSVKGSTAVFKSLLAAMLKKDNIAVCRYVRTRRTEPCLVALVPQEEVLDEAGYQVWAEGLHLIRLPFKDDIRNPESEPSQVGTQLPVADLDQIDTARKVIENLQYEGFALGAVPNPALVRHFDVLESLALNEEPPDLDDLEDETKPPDDIDEVAQPQLKEFRDAVSLGVGGGGAGTKRKAPAEDLSTAEAYKLRDWSETSREGRLSKLTIPDLKVYLKFHKLAMSGNKSDLVARIEEHMHSGAA